MNRNINKVENNISNTLAQMKITELPASFDTKLHMALLAEKDKMSQKVTAVVMPWQKIMALAASFLLAVSVGLLSAEYINKGNLYTDDITSDIVDSVTEDLVAVEKVPNHLLDVNIATMSCSPSCSDRERADVINSASLTSMRGDMEREGYHKIMDCKSLEQCLAYLSDNNLDSSQCMVVGYIGQTSYVILSDMENLVAGDSGNLETLVGLYEVYSK